MCHALVHSAELEAIAKRAQELETQGEPAASADVWRQALLLLPPDSNQATAIRDRIASLGAAVRTAGSQQERPAWMKRLGPLGVVLAFLLKFKTAAFLVLSKAKFLFLGLGKLQTLLSMFATIGLYWSLYGWKFAVGFVVGIYIHEMGHVWALRHYGLRASAPMFIPGFGAFVSLYDSPANVSQDARIGLAGPLWGAAAGLMFLAMGAATGAGVWFAIAHFTAYINLFNLLPVWSLDGGRAFRAFDRTQRFIALGLTLVLWLVTHETMFMIVGLGAGYRAFMQKDYPPESDQGAFLQYVGLLILFGAMLGLMPTGGMLAR